MLMKLTPDWGDERVGQVLLGLRSVGGSFISWWSHGSSHSDKVSLHPAWTSGLSFLLVNKCSLQLTVYARVYRNAARFQRLKSQCVAFSADRKISIENVTHCVKYKKTNVSLETWKKTLVELNSGRRKTVLSTWKKLWFQQNIEFTSYWNWTNLLLEVLDKVILRSTSFWCKIIEIVLHTWSNF